MHTSVSFRALAGKIFWGDSDTYYFVAASWILRGGYLGYASHDQSFTAFVQNVEIRWDRIDSDQEIEAMKDNVCGKAEEKARQFWETLQTHFPHVKHVVVTEFWAPVLCIQHNNDPVSCDVLAVIKTCPVEIDIRVSKTWRFPTRQHISQPALPFEFRSQRSFYRLEEGGGWKTLTPSGPKHKLIIMPPKNFQGSFGEFFRDVYEAEKVWGQHGAFSLVAFAALERHYLGKDNYRPVVCPFDDCGSHVFNKPGQWMRHAVEVHSDQLRPSVKLTGFPRPLRSILREGWTDLRKRHSTVYERMSKWETDWKQADVDKRERLERDFLYQLDTDENWKTEFSGTEIGLIQRLLVMVGSDHVFGYLGHLE